MAGPGPGRHREPENGPAGPKLKTSFEQKVTSGTVRTLSSSRGTRARRLSVGRGHRRLAWPSRRAQRKSPPGGRSKPHCSQFRWASTLIFGSCRDTALRSSCAPSQVGTTRIKLRNLHLYTPRCTYTSFYCVSLTVVSLMRISHTEMNDTYERDINIYVQWLFKSTTKQTISATLAISALEASGHRNMYTHTALASKPKPYNVFHEGAKNNNKKSERLRKMQFLHIHLCHVPKCCWTLGSIYTFV